MNANEFARLINGTQTGSGTSGLWVRYPGVTITLLFAACFLLIPGIAQANCSNTVLAELTASLTNAKSQLTTAQTAHQRQVTKCNTTINIRRSKIATLRRNRAPSAVMRSMRKKLKNFQSKCNKATAASITGVNQLVNSVSALEQLISECQQPSAPIESPEENPENGGGDDDSEEPADEPLPLMPEHPRAQSLEQWGVTFFFDKAYRFGKFVNGDYWVVPDEGETQVVVTRITPDYAGNRNGFEVDPNRGASHGFDSRAAGFNPTLVPALPLVVTGTKSIVKGVSTNLYCADVDLPCLDTAVVLTVLPSIPANSGLTVFRPPYIKGPKPLVDFEQVNTSIFPSLTPPVGVEIPTLDSVRHSVERLQLDHTPNWDRSLRPIHNSPSYGGGIAQRNAEVIQRLLLNDPLSAKLPTIVALVQYGIDLKHLFMAGQTYPGAGGHGQGRFGIAILAATLLNDQYLKQFISSASENTFGETGQTYFSAVTGQPLWGEWLSQCSEFQYWDAMRSHAIARTCRDPYGLIDGGELPGAIYQTCCSTGYFKSTYLFLKLIPATANFYNDPAFDQYVERFLTMGAYTQPDYCAPGKGLCSGGVNHGQACTTANANIICTGFKPDNQPATCDPDMSLYGVEFGPDGAGGCIIDSDFTDGIGRFPWKHNTVVNEAWGLTPFQKKMEAHYLDLP